jgi:hypothetical protein
MGAGAHVRQSLAAAIPAVIVVGVRAEEVHRFGEESALVLEVPPRPLHRQRQRRLVHAEQRTHHLEVAAGEQRPVGQAGVLEPVRTAPIAEIGVVTWAIDVEDRAVELDGRAAPPRTGEHEPLQSVALRDEFAVGRVRAGRKVADDFPVGKHPHAGVDIERHGHVRPLARAKIRVGAENAQAKDRPQAAVQEIPLGQAAGTA